MDDSDARRPRWGLKVAAALFALLLLAIIVTWTQRTPIAQNFVDAELSARDVPARYEITRLTPSVQRLEHIVIGDPEAPDLTADWAELRLTYGFGWPSVRSITAGGVRLHGRLIEGKVTFGAIDRLLPPPSDAPFTLPDVTVNLSDARMRLATPFGAVGMALDGRGNLADGFEGRLAAISERLAFGDCSVGHATAWVRIAITDRRPTLDGPLRARDLSCRNSGLAISAPRVRLAATLAEALDNWRGDARIEAAGVAQGANRVEAVAGAIGFDGSAAGTKGNLRLTAGAARTGQGNAAGAAFDGRYDLAARGASGLEGDVRVTGLALAPAMLRPVSTAFAAADGTPLGPLGRALAEAIGRAGRRADIDGRLVLASRPGEGNLRVVRLNAASASGARLALGGGEGLSYTWPAGVSRIDGRLQLSGGGLPTARIDLRQAAPGAPVVGLARVEPYAAGGSRLALGPVRFTDGGGVTRFDTVVTLDGPIGDGRVQGLHLPVSGRFAGAALAINERCVPLDFASLSLAGMVLGPTRLPLCPVGGALVARSAGGALRGGAVVARPRLAGRVGNSPLLMTADRLRADLGAPGFTLDALAVRLGAGEAVTRLDVAQLGGSIDARGLGGRFEGAAGKIANVPLLMSDGGGTWRLAGGNLALEGRVRVADEAAEPRFNPLVSDDVRLTLIGGVIRGGGQLREPTTGRAVTRVTLTHDLSRGRGAAVLDVPALTFDKGFQPERLTRLTLGVVADVAGTIAGRGDIAWSPDGVTSGGTFSTDGMALAAAFGPLTGLRGTLHFSDLLALATAPGQEVFLGEVNPGIAVTGGVVRYQLLPEQHVRIEGGEWPFSGGRLVLEPTELDLGRPVERHLTFRVEGLDAALFLQQFEFDNVAATGLFDGRLPMVFDATGGRIVGGRLDVRRGGGTLAYVGQMSNEDLGMFGSMAFDALKSMKYENLAIELDGALDGELISRILFTGTNERPLGDAPKGMLRQFTGLPFRFNIVVRAPFRGLLNTATNFADPTALIRDSAGKGAPGVAPEPVQPQESGDQR